MAPTTMPAISAGARPDGNADGVEVGVDVVDVVGVEGVLVLDDVTVPVLVLVLVGAELNEEDDEDRDEVEVVMVVLVGSGTTVVVEERAVLVDVLDEDGGGGGGGGITVVELAGLDVGVNVVVVNVVVVRVVGPVTEVEDEVGVCGGDVVDVLKTVVVTKTVVTALGAMDVVEKTTLVIVTVVWVRMVVVVTTMDVIVVLSRL
jgi:hypothetical protein